MLNKIKRHTIDLYNAIVSDLYNDIFSLPSVTRFRKTVIWREEITFLITDFFRRSIKKERNETNDNSRR